MKKIFIRSLLSVLFCSISFASLAQGNKKLLEKWSNLQLGMLRQTVVARQFVSIWPGPNEERNEILNLSSRIDAQIEASKYPDSLSIAIITHLQDRLINRLENAFKQIENDPELRIKQDILNMQAQLEGTINRIDVKARNYNLQISKMNRPYLLFNLKDRGHIPKVIFD